MNEQRLLDLARHNGFITAADISKASAEATRISTDGVSVTALDVLMSRGLLDDDQIADLQGVDDTASLPSPPPGYRILARLGGGGMGNVFLATALSDDCQVAIKMLPAHLVNDEEYRARFQREVQALDALDHPHIIGFKGAGRHQDSPYLVMDHHPGCDLKQHLREQGALSLVEAWHLLLQMTEALHHCAQRGIVHRDVKPSNIILTPARPRHREPFCAILIDFGLAKGAASDCLIGNPLTGTGIAVGTPHYMSPEAATGSKALDPRLDIYSLAATVVHALQGKTLYSGRSSAVIMYQQATAAPDLQPLKGLGVSTDLQALLEDMLSKDQGHRLIDWDAVLKRIAAIRPPAGSEEPSTGLAARQRRRPRMIATIALSGLAVILLIAGLILTLAGQGERIVPVTPQNWTTVLAELDHRAEGDVILDLAPGTYPITTPLALGKRSLTMRGPDAVLSAQADLDHLIHWQPADQTQRLLLVDITLQGAGLTQHGGRLQLRRVRIQAADTAVTTQDGHCEAHELDISDVDHALVINDSTVHINQAVIKARQSLLQGDQGRLHLNNCRLVSDDRFDSDLPAVTWHGGTMRWEDVHITARHRRTAIMLSALDWGEWRSVKIIGASLAIRSQDSHLSVIQGLDIEATDIGLHWHGAIPQARAWRNLTITAPQPTIGIDIP